jgi:amino acid transporter
MYAVLKRLLLGRPLRSADQEHQRLIKVIALAIFSSDAISSTAYATEEILHVLVPLAGLAALDYLIPISFVVVTLLAIVVFSYRQTIFAYPNGGGSYIVSRENLGETPALVAGASLLVDYTLTVAVSVSAGVAAITSAVKPLAEHRVELGLALIVLVTLGNLRGRSSPSPPTSTWGSSACSSCGVSGSRSPAASTAFPSTRSSSTTSPGAGRR